ncbi:tetratricopeptide repeat protein [Alphaproteobacteria bacterium]|nr:tetratricopeptide repeat protein [Alphaproteobacteria bacterium]
MSEQKILNLLKSNQLIEAKQLIETVLKSENNNLTYIFYYGLILANEKKYERAISFFEQVLLADKSHYDSNFNIAGCYQGLLIFDKAIEHYKNCSKINTNKFEPYHQIGICYKQLREYENSITNLKKALKISVNAKTSNVLGNVYRENGQFEEAKKCFEKSLNINKEFVQSKLSLTNLEIDDGNYDLASKMLEEVIQSNNNDQILLSAKVMVANILKSKGEFEKAIKVNQDILIKDPKNIDASYNISQCYLFTKEYEKAWIFHESRYDLQNLVLLKQIHNSFSKPKWDLSRQKKNVLFYGEQGIGEQIIYSQFYETIKEQFENSTIAVNEKLIPFFKKIYTNTKIINYKKVFEYNEYDYHLPLGSMGLYFQKYINQKNLKRKIEYLSNSNIPIKTKKLRCGISWKSTNRIFGNKKSIKLENLKNILSNENIEFINLQYSDEKKDIELLEKSLEKKIFTDHDIDCFNDIDGVAGLIKSCDFIITVSNSNAHISGKLGVKTFLLLPFNEGKLWYWGLNTDKYIVWYPSILPIRQESLNDWESCLDKLYKEFENYL